MPTSKTSSMRQRSTERASSVRKDVASRRARRLSFPVRLVTPRTILRRITLEDAPGWKAFNNAIARRMLEDDPPQRWPVVPSIVYARNELLHADADWRAGSRYMYAIVDRVSGKVIGDFHVSGIDSRRMRAEYGHALHPQVWGTGITYETLNAVNRAAKARGITLWGKVGLDNARSYKSLERYGAKYCGIRTFTVEGKPTRMRVYELR